jgi:CubicO group peptidase (beta-lactamase class C family)
MVRRKIQMSKLQVTIDPKEVGMSAERLKRIDEHFQQYVDDGRLPGYTVAVARYGQIAHVSTYGMRDMESKLPTELDTMYRIASMTKPITSIACMMLVEEGKLQLTDPVSRFIPKFRHTQVYESGTAQNPVLVPMKEPMRVWHLLSHTSGLTYAHNYSHVVDEMYRNAGFGLVSHGDETLEQICDRVADMPLVFEPGSSWIYGVSTDVLGRVIEVASGMSLNDFFQTRILQPLKMHDTSFWVPTEKLSRLAAVYTPDETGLKAVRLPSMEQSVLTKPTAFSGGGGLVSTAYDYWRFLQMLENGGELDGVRLISPTTLDLMTKNHLPNNQDVSQFGRVVGEEVFYDGLGFGLGFAVVIDQARTKVACSDGTYSWGGIFSTAFWIDPVEEITATFYTQLIPSTIYPIRPFLRSMVYGAIIE